jgi:hypothetical protein
MVAGERRRPAQSSSAVGCTAVLPWRVAWLTIVPLKAGVTSAQVTTTGATASRSKRKHVSPRESRLGTACGVVNDRPIRSNAIRQPHRSKGFVRTRIKLEHIGDHCPARESNRRWRQKRDSGKPVARSRLHRPAFSGHTVVERSNSCWDVRSRRGLAARRRSRRGDRIGFALSDCRGFSPTHHDVVTVDRGSGLRDRPDLEFIGSEHEESVPSERTARSRVFDDVPQLGVM